MRIFINTDHHHQRKIKPLFDQLFLNLDQRRGIHNGWLHNFKDSYFTLSTRVEIHALRSEGEGLSRRNFNQMNRYPETVDLSTSRPAGDVSSFSRAAASYRPGGKRSATIRSATIRPVIHYTGAFEEFLVDNAVGTWFLRFLPSVQTHTKRSRSTRTGGIIIIIISFLYS